MTVFVHIVSWLLALAAIPLGIAVAVFAAQIVSAAVQGQAPAPARGPTATRARLAVLLPAHDEAGGIAQTLAGVKPQLRTGDRLLVVADNCGDDTAAIARLAGANVVERFHETQRGKGFALAHGVDALRADPPDLVVILDADCDIAPGALDALADCVARTDRPAQALYLMLAAPAAGLPRRLAQFAWRVRNWVRPAGWHALGLPCQLMGTGMAFTWTMLRDAPLANASIVEDMKLGIDLACAGQAPVFCATALVTSSFPEAAAATRTQRTRWEHGHLEMILREVPAMVSRGLARGDTRLIGMALDLCVPPLALLAAALIGTTAVAALLRVISTGPALLWMHGALLGVFVFSALLAWAVRGQDLVRFRELLSIPLYIGAKLPIYLRFLIRRQKQWVRTDRDKR
jgi:cellulose synthase/poly-beta-1,6-N-acetylglucosamine synthase-like glycosyltransferase